MIIIMPCNVKHTAIFSLDTEKVDFANWLEPFPLLIVFLGGGSGAVFGTVVDAYDTEAVLLGDTTGSSDSDAGIDVLDPRFVFDGDGDDVLFTGRAAMMFFLGSGFGATVIACDSRDTVLGGGGGAGKDFGRLDTVGLLL